MSKILIKYDRKPMWEPMWDYFIIVYVVISIYTILEIMSNISDDPFWSFHAIIPETSS